MADGQPQTTERGTLHCRCDPRGEEMCLVKTSLADRLCGYLCQRLVAKQENARGKVTIRKQRSGIDKTPVPIVISFATDEPAAQRILDGLPPNHFPDHIRQVETARRSLTILVSFIDIAGLSTRVFFVAARWRGNPHRCDKLIS
jgi:hypothetical protein